MLLQVVKQLGNYVQTTNLSSIHNEDEILNAASSELLNQAQFVTTQPEEFKKDLATFCQNVGALHLAADLSLQKQAETRLRDVLAAFEKVKGYFSPRVLAAALPSLNNYSCPYHPEVIGMAGDVCPKCGAKLDLFCRLLPANSIFAHKGQPTIQALVRTAAPLTVGLPATALLHLQRPNGLPLTLADLIETHTKKIHLLIVDQSLTDYHHEHPLPAEKPGDYSFSFTPRKPGSYRVWADVRSYPLGLQEYVQTDIAANTAGEPLTDRELKLKSTVDGLNYELLFDQPEIHAGQPAAFKLRVTTPAGAGVTNLEPVMATFAHLVGFSEDYQTVLHLHPKLPPVLDRAARGGPELDFVLYAAKPGFVRIFAQVQIDGRAHFAPFGLKIAP